MPDLRQGEDIPVYIWYENYPTHAADEYKGRVAGVNPESSYGQASLNLTNIRETDQGWYECKVVFLNRAPNQNKNGTWFHLDVHGECQAPRGGLSYPDACTRSGARMGASPASGA